MTKNTIKVSHLGTLTIPATARGLDHTPTRRSWIRRAALVAIESRNPAISRELAVRIAARIAAEC